MTPEENNAAHASAHARTLQEAAARGAFDSPDACEPEWPAEPAVRYVNAYEVTLGYGGPEEGGWWYDVGTPLASIPFQTPEEEQAAREVIERTMRPRFAGNPGKSSVASGAADLSVHVDDEPAAAFPTERPFYE